MDANRRGFLFGLGALLVATPKLIVSPIPVLHGDGIHDDTEALQALFDGKPVKLPTGDTFAPGRFPELRGGDYRITRTVHINAREVRMGNARIRQSAEIDGHLLYLNAPNASIWNVHLDNSQTFVDGRWIKGPSTVLRVGHGAGLKAVA